MKLSKSTLVLQLLNSKLLLNININKSSLNKIISEDNFPCINYIYQINKLLMKSHISKKEIYEYKSIFWEQKNCFQKFDDIKGYNINQKELFNENNCLFSMCSCINLIERIIKYGKFKKNIVGNSNNEFIANVLLLNVFETSIDEKSDSNENDKNKLELFLSIISYNEFSNDLNNSNYFRLPYIYENYIRNNDEIENCFYKKNNYSIKNYLLFLQLFSLVGSYKYQILEEPFLNNSSNAKEIKLCINDHIFDHNSREEKEKIIISSYIPYEKLICKPILKFDNKYLFINPGLIKNRIYEIFFKKIENSVNNKALFSRKFYGSIFENYCRDIAKICIKKSKFKYYKFIKSFKYVDKNGNGKESSDFYICYNNITIIFEIKSTGRFIETTKNDDTKDYDKFLNEEYNRKISMPLNQIERRLTEIKSLNNLKHEENLIKNSETYFYVVVSDEIINNNTYFYIKHLSKLHSLYSGYLPLYINISEYEYLMKSLELRKKPIDKLLQHYHKEYYNSNFTDMIIKERKEFKFKKLDLISKNNYIDDFKEVLIK